MKHRADTEPQTEPNMAEIYAQVTGAIKVTYSVEHVINGETLTEEICTYETPKHRKSCETP